MTTSSRNPAVNNMGLSKQEVREHYGIPEHIDDCLPLTRWQHESKSSAIEIGQHRTNKKTPRYLMVSRGIFFSGRSIGTPSYRLV